MAERKYTYEDFLAGVNKNPSGAQSLLTNEFLFTADGLIELYNSNNLAVKAFFTDFIGEEFDINNEVIIGKVLKKGRGDNSNIAKVMEFIYNLRNQSKGEVMSTEETKSMDSNEGTPSNEVKEKVEKVDRKKLTNSEIPFREGTIQHDCFKVMLTKFDSTRDEILTEIEPIFAAYNKTNVNRKMVFNNIISQANKRGYHIVIDKETGKVTNAA